MKVLENKEITIENKTSSYRDLILLCLNNPPEKGFTREELKARDRIEACLTAQTDGLFHLEDADYVKLKSIVNDMRWIVRSPMLIAFLDYIQEDRELKKP